MKFEIGKCYKHTVVGKMRIVGEVDTYIYGKCLVGEMEDTGALIPVGYDENCVSNWTECDDFAKGGENE